MAPDTAHQPIHHAQGAQGAQAPNSAEGFLAELVRRPCDAGVASAGAVLRLRLTTVADSEGARPVEGDADVLAIHPAIAPDDDLPDWIEPAAAAASRHLQSGEHAPGATPFEPVDDEAIERRWVVTVPLHFGVGEAPSAVAVFLVEASQHAITDAIDSLAPVARRFAAHEERLRAEPKSPVARMNAAVAPLLAANAQERYFAAAVGVCNEIEAGLDARRVSVGFLRGRDVRLGAMSHTEKIVRSMRLVRDIESAMEECLDQDREVLVPAPPDSGAVDRAANALAEAHGPSSVCVVPLRARGEPVGALCVERAVSKPLTEDEVESVRLACALVTPRLHDLFKRDRWIGARAAVSVRRSLAALLGPTHTWAKLAALAGFAFVLFLVFAKGTHHVSAPCTLRTIERRVAPAPFDGYLESRTAQIGDGVRAGDSLAILDDSALRLERAEALSALRAHEAEADRARGAGRTADALIADARARETQARIDLLDWRIGRAIVRAPIDGVVVEGDLDAIIGAPVRAGDVLFVVAPLDALRAELLVDESQIADVRVGANGSLATASAPGLRVPFSVARIDPIALEDEHRGAFRVIAHPGEAPDWLRPGMEGVAKIDAGRRRYAWLWSHRLVDWLRMKLWL